MHTSVQNHQTATFIYLTTAKYVFATNMLLTDNTVYPKAQITECVPMGGSMPMQVPYMPSVVKTI